MATEQFKLCYYIYIPLCNFSVTSLLHFCFFRTDFAAPAQNNEKSRSTGEFYMKNRAILAQNDEKSRSTGEICMKIAQHRRNLYEIHQHLDYLLLITYLDYLLPITY